MSMIFCLSSVSDQTMSKLTANPPLIWQIVNPEYDPSQIKEPGGIMGLLSGFFRKKKEAVAALPKLELSADERIEQDLDKAWHGIHYLLTTSEWEGDWPWSFLLKDGQPVGDIDVGYGEARVYTASQVREIDAALETISKEKFESRFAPDKMMELEIYPTIWNRSPEDDDTLGYLSEYFMMLKQYIHNLTQKNLGVVVWLC